MSRDLLLTANRDFVRLDSFLVEFCRDISRSRLQGLIRDGFVSVDGRLCKSATKIRYGNVVRVHMPPPKSTHMKPQDIPISVVYQDEELLVVDKPSGIPVHPGPGHPDGTLVNAILAICPDISGVGGVLRPGIVHRLDIGTSGLMVVAKTDRSHAHLSSQVSRREFTKIYQGLVHGNLKQSEALIDAPIGRDTKHRQRMAVVNEGKEALTKYFTVRRYKKFTLAQIKLITGRTHQIRVHFAALGNPIAGDTTYGSSIVLDECHFLHSYSLGFRHPVNGRPLEFHSDLPAKLQSFLSNLVG